MNSVQLMDQDTDTDLRTRIQTQSRKAPPQPAEGRLQTPAEVGQLAALAGVLICRIRSRQRHRHQRVARRVVMIGTTGTVRSRHPAWRQAQQLGMRLAVDLKLAGRQRLKVGPLQVERLSPSAPFRVELLHGRVSRCRQTLRMQTAGLLLEYARTRQQYMADWHGDGKASSGTTCSSLSSFCAGFCAGSAGGSFQYSSRLRRPAPALWLRSRPRPPSKSSTICIFSMLTCPWPLSRSAPPAAAPQDLQHASI